ncbi:PIN domain-containing protein [Pectobacterium aroidearum]|uniref:PIN domain-containing protein n=1 Tax=Pectobacterium aroidearum TaxID=1201031 RepID=UPI002A8128D4|nr:PIN domain-containing protein [Pectobacterium aroidearum]MDY4385042.1 PIN domain-containing protein [Pectobacterium aroidearum]
MTNTLRSRLAFIDTSAYEAKNFNFLEHQLKKIKSLCNEDKIRILTTNITIEEVKSHLKKKATLAFEYIKKSKSELKILRNLPDLESSHIFLDENSAEDIYDKLLRNFENFLDGENIEIVPMEKANVDVIFDDYFSLNPPFSDKKKNEFPDAFVLSAIGSIAIERQNSIYVISQDVDMKNSCDNEKLISLNRVDDFIDLVIRNENDLSEPLVLADRIFEMMSGNIVDNILHELEDVSFTSSKYPNAEYIEASINGCEISSKNIIDISDGNFQYEVELKLDIYASIYETDYGRSPWDHEDEKYVFLFKNETNATFTEKISAIVDITIFDGISANAEVSYMSLPSEIELAMADGRKMVYTEHHLD